MLYDDIFVTGSRAVGRSYAKINLTLGVNEKREDGYHLIETVMQTVNLSDIVIADVTEDRNIHITTNKKFLPTNEKNIAYKASKLFLDELGVKKGVKILIHKNIPVAAGLAGGSGNAAAVLCALNMLFSMPFDDEKLFKMGAQLGADIPFCMMKKTQLATGIGDILTPVKGMEKTYVLLVTPPVPISTPWVYSEYDNLINPPKPDTEGMVKALEKGNLSEICGKLSNSLECVTIAKHPVIGGIKEKMIKNGAVGALMSGSGATVFGFFDDYKKAKASMDSFSFMYKDVYLTTTL